MKLVIRIVLGFILVAGIGFGVLAYMNRPISKEAVTEKIEQRLTNVLEKNDSLSSALLTIYSGETGYFEQFAVGTTNRSSDQPVRTDSPYHAASIGKTMNAVIYGLLVDEGKISFDNKIDSWLEDDILKGLFVVNGTDYSDKVTLKHLLSHTSGVGDYFEGPVRSGKPLLEMITANPDLSFTPEELIAFARDHQDPVGTPGQQFYYSDTGYVLLGLILEAIEGKSYSDILEERIFEPLGMKNSYLMFYQEKPADILGIYLNGIDLSDRNALSVDWAGGGVVTTMDDLLAFMRALENGAFLSDEVYGQMTDFSHRYDKGIYYGMGMMRFDFSELSFLLGSMTDVYGGVGATGTYVLYDKAKDTFFIANFGSLGFAEKGIEELVKIRMIYDRMKVE
ncbi:serine hydrolase domain-containing protein [Paenibacillus sp. LHD-117]|uniref:serine hydrolase domain-containing protein n=1 Tax=Paenibacillus sp. LHD-117 TaxID=3071412 RepID=UPI0027E0DC81|nr:serine hydrolase domain-containing protein [Paenibacillus sp. LHD-117]MDQ6422000.1 serine hydrolase domain-containing protein [Paenibacillus sp. LHD-117]